MKIGRRGFFGLMAGLALGAKEVLGEGEDPETEATFGAGNAPYLDSSGRFSVVYKRGKTFLRMPAAPADEKYTVCWWDEGLGLSAFIKTTAGERVLIPNRPDQLSVVRGWINYHPNANFGWDQPGFSVVRDLKTSQSNLLR